jgi:hypothetical protein
MKTSSAAMRSITSILVATTMQNIEKTAHLVSLVRPNQLRYSPSTPAGSPPVTDLGHLLGHLLDCLAGFCAAFYVAFPKKLASLQNLRNNQVNHFCEPAEALKRIRIYQAEIERGFRLCTDKDLKRKLRTFFRPEGELLLAILLANLEHLLNHKYQLFFYLRLLGEPVGTKDLYSLQEARRKLRKKPK